MNMVKFSSYPHNYRIFSGVKVVSSHGDPHEHDEGWESSNKSLNLQ